MDEGLFQLLFILFILVAAVLDALARSRKKQRRKEEMEREEAEAGDAVDEIPGDVEPEAGPRSWEREEADVPEWEEWAPASGEGAEGPGPRTADSGLEGGADPGRSADEMIPADLWTEITGERRAPPSREEPGPGERERTAERKAEPPRSPPRPLSQRGPPPAPEPPPSPHDSVRREFPQARPSPHRRRDEERPRAPAREAGSAHGDPGTEVPDERTLRRRAMAEEGKRRADAPKRRPRRRAGGLIPRGDSDALRRAVLYREILGPPVGFRPRGGGWEEDAIAFHAGPPRPGSDASEGSGAPERTEAPGEPGASGDPPEGGEADEGGREGK